MKLWLLTQSQNGGYDTHNSCVVAAKNEETARLIRPDGSEWDNTSYGTWAHSPDKVNAELIGTAKEGTEEGIILSSYNAG